MICIKRIKIIQNLIFAVIFAMVLRVSYIALFQHKEYSNAAQKQYEEIYENRGIIYDRNMIKVRENDNGVLNHLMGYASSGGNYGIEKAFDKELKYAEKYGGVCLTIDYHIQKLVEKTMDDKNINGAVIVADIENGDVLAMASRPNFSLDGNGETENGAMMNKALGAYNPGSVFKIITAAAALETNCSEEMMFECEGGLEIDGMEFLCNDADGHGSLSFYDAMANSCNCAFYNIGISTGGENICKYATAFGLGDYVLNIEGIGESKGNIPSKKIFTKRETANISIGQGDILATPLQVTDMMLTVANEGVRKQLRVVKGIVDGEGNVAETKGTDLGRVISQSTARKLMEMLVKTVKEGTGKNADVKKTGAGGKTGTAQTGWLKGNSTMTHGWFAGFFPEENPRYVCVVFAEDGKSGSMAATPVFKEIGENIDFR